MVEPKITAYEFGPFRLDMAERRLLCEHQPVPLTPKLFDILLLLVRNHGKLVEKETLMKEIWSDSFVEENNLTVSISALRKILGERYREREYIETVAKRGYRFVAKVRQIEEGVMEQDGVREATAGERKATSEHAKSITSLAVLPFTNVGTGPDLEYLSDGITENTIFSLSRLPQLRVMARSTVFRYKGREIDPRQVGRELKVQMVLIGRLSRFNERLFLSMEMVDVSDGSQLWGEQYNYPLSDIFRVQEEIAAELSEKLRIRVTVEEKKRLSMCHTQNSEAYNLYLKGRYFWNKRILKDINRAIQYFEEAIRLDANYALAYVGLADCYIRLIILNALTVADGLPTIRREVGRALELDETLAEAHASLGYVEMLALNWPEAERAYLRALELNPNNAMARSRYSLLLAMRGEAEEAIAQIEQALAIDPLYTPTRLNAANIFYLVRQYKRAIEQCREALEIEPHCAAAHGLLSLIYERRGAYEEAISEIQRALSLKKDDPEALAILGYIYAISGRRRESKRVLNKMLKLSEQSYISPFFMACVYAGLREKERTLEWLEKAYEERSYIQILAMFPPFDYLHPDPLFADLLGRVGLQLGTPA